MPQGMIGDLARKIRSAHSGSGKFGGIQKAATLKECRNIYKNVIKKKKSGTLVISFSGYNYPFSKSDIENDNIHKGDKHSKKLLIVFQNGTPDKD